MNHDQDLQRMIWSDDKKSIGDLTSIDIILSKSWSWFIRTEAL